MEREACKEEEEEEEGQWGCTVPLLPVTAELSCLESKGPVVSGRVGAGEVVDGDGVVGASVVHNKQPHKQKGMDKRQNHSDKGEDNITITMEQMKHNSCMLTQGK